MTYVKTTLQQEIEIDSIITIHYFEYMKDFVFHGESHDFWEFVYVDKGNVQVRSGEDDLLLNTGDVVFHQPNEFHAIRSVGNSSPNLVVVSFVSHSPAISFFRKKYYSLTKEERTLISQLVSVARESFSSPLHIPAVEQVELNPEAPFGAQQMILLYLELFLITGIRTHSTIPTLPAMAKRIPKTNPLFQEMRLETIIQYMQLRISEQLHLSDLCDKFSLSKSSLQNLFHEQKGCGVMEYYNWLKIERSKDIIREGAMNLTEIAYYLSFSSPSYFSRCFKRQTGMSPLEYATSVKGISQALKRKNPEKKERP